MKLRNRELMKQRIATLLVAAACMLLAGVVQAQRPMRTHQSQARKVKPQKKTRALPKPKKVAAPKVSKQVGNLDRLPSYHPTRWLRDGESKRIKSVTFQRGATRTNRASARKDRVFNNPAEAVRNSPNSPHRRAHQAHQAEVAQRNGQGLSQRKKRDLSQAYRISADRMASIQVAVRNKSMTFKQAIEQTTDVILERMKAERRVFGGQSNKLPSGNLLRGRRMTQRDIAKARKTIHKFVSGSYLKPSQGQRTLNRKRSPGEPNEGRSFEYAIPSSQKSAKLNQAEQRRLNYSTPSSTASGRKDAPPKKEVKKTKSEPELLGLEFRVYTAEHTVSGDCKGCGCDMMHSSVVAGKWKLLLSEIEERTYENGQLVRTVGSHHFEEEFDGWLIANGAVGAYHEETETLCEHLRVAFETEEELNKFAFGVQKSAESYGNGWGQYPFHRVAAYSAGYYLTDWVCHHAANAFVARRWGIPHVVSSYFTDLYLGFYGMWGISADYAWLEMQEGCVPGAQCLGHVSPPWVTIPDIVSLDQEGYGFGLETYWHPDHGYIYSNAKFKKQPVPFDGPSQVTITELFDSDDYKE